MSLVLDSSVALAWLYAEETTKAMQRVVDVVISSGAWVPSIWRLEVANSLQTAVRRGRISGDVRDRSLTDLASMKIMTDAHTDTSAWTTTLRLADRFRLTAYDAAYLELAHRRSLPLASLDRDLRAADDELGIALLGE